MLKTIIRFYKIARQMPARYVAFRLFYEIRKKTGILKWKFPANEEVGTLVSIKEWLSASPVFFDWKLSELPKLSQAELESLQNRTDKIRNNMYPFFTDQEIFIDLHDWHSNPRTGYIYDKSSHWTKLSDFDVEAGDIKYVWEKARFSWLYNFIRENAHSNSDSSSFVFKSIESFIDNNPINLGPHYICSQEISIRLLNWVFALHFYAKSKFLTERIFHKIISAVFLQVKHVYSNIQFSRVAVRNNHALTETLTLYLMGVLFPQMPGAAQWKKNGKKWFEEEVAYQIYDDGSYLQYSMNYHRVVVQLLTWAITLSELNGEKLDSIVYERARKSIDFLEGCQDPVSGNLPHYGSNDGALFFPLNNYDYRDYRPQINALRAALKLPVSEGFDEDVFWYGLDLVVEKKKLSPDNQKSKAFEVGGYYSFKDSDSLTFVRCGSHLNRPSQADNLHLDIWVRGVNILRDSGTYLYNGVKDEVSYFNSTRAHNTLQIDKMDQMEKGPRFVWLNWTKAIKTRVEETNEFWEFEGAISAFKSMIVTRKVRRYKSKLLWVVEDFVKGKPENFLLHQHWHPGGEPGNVSFVSETRDGSTLELAKTLGWFAPNYGIRHEAEIITFSTPQNYIKTQIRLNS